tara:strand:- start:1507 stop:3372 length:1866 start_codon:yes stop_codon:yes gene_type:complete
MSWEEGSQKRPPKEDFNKILSEIEGYIDEDEAKVLLYKFLKENITFAADLISGVELFPFQHMAIKAMFETDYTLGIWSRGMSKSFTTGIYAFLDAIFNQGVEIGILSKSFRQSKMIFKKIEDIAAKPEASFLSQCITHKSKSNDEWLLEIGQSRIRALPLGDGSKLRGFRFHRIIIDEFLLMPERIYNEVIVPFLSVVENPVERERMFQMENKLIKEGKLKEEDRHKWPNNKLIALSSASYKFEYLYKVYEQFEMLINGSIKEDGDATRCIMQFSYDCAPQKLYDENLILQSKQTMSHSQFEREFGAIFTDDSSGYFKTSKMAECTIPDGEDPSVEVKGDPDSEYIVSFDPSWAESESSDDFAMHVFKINNETKQGTMVHGYALSGTNLKHHIQYFHYLLTHFNVAAVVGDYNGGVQFINACNESSLFSQSKIKISMLSSDFDKPEKYEEDLAIAKKEYDKGSRCYCVLRKPTSSWIRMANELLQSNLDHKRIWFGSRAMDESYHKQIKQKIPINDLKYLNIADQKENVGAKMIDFVEHQSDMIDLTKTQCALVQIKTTSQGTQTFDLPDTLKRTTGPNKARKDSYSSMVLGNWMVKVYYDFMNYQTPVTQVQTFTPSFIK